jgi:hypothetical protein
MSYGIAIMEVLYKSSGIQSSKYLEISKILKLLFRDVAIRYTPVLPVTEKKKILSSSLVRRPAHPIFFFFFSIFFIMRALMIHRESNISIDKDTPSF